MRNDRPLGIARVYGRALLMLSSELKVVSTLVLASFAVAAVEIVEPILFGRAIDAMSTRHEAALIVTMWASLGMVGLIASIFLASLNDRMAHRQRLAALSSAVEQTMTLPISYHAEAGSARILRIMLVGTDQLFTLWVSLREHLTAIPAFIFLLPTAFSMNASLAGLLVSLAVIYFVANSFVIRRTVGLLTTVEHSYQAVYGQVGDLIGNVAVVQSYTRLKEEMNALRGMIGDLLNAQYPMLTWWTLLTFLTRCATIVSMVAVFSVGSVLTAHGQASVGEIVAFVGFANLLIAKLDQLSGFVARIVFQAPALTNLFNLLDSAVSSAERPEVVHLQEVRGTVRFENVTFKFPNSEQGVYNLSFEVASGETVALVGATGAGKTTALALMQRFYDPQEGRIFIDGVDIRGVSLGSLRRSIGMVFQETFLFNRSIAENIRVGRPTANEDEIETAARLAEAHEFICSKPEGYQFVVGERGANLSVGERQRIAIARALLKDAPILVADELTNALDNETEANVNRTLEVLRRGRTTFLIAHRLSCTINAHRILVINRGRVVEAGTYRDLVAAGGYFARLLEAGRGEADSAGVLAE